MCWLWNHRIFIAASMTRETSCSFTTFSSLTPKHHPQSFTEWHQKIWCILIWFDAIVANSYCCLCERHTSTFLFNLIEWNHCNTDSTVIELTRNDETYSSKRDQTSSEEEDSTAEKGATGSEAIQIKLYSFLHTCARRHQKEFTGGTSFCK